MPIQATARIVKPTMWVLNQTWKLRNLGTLSQDEVETTRKMEEKVSQMKPHWRAHWYLRTMAKI